MDASGFFLIIHFILGFYASFFIYSPFCAGRWVEQTEQRTVPQGSRKCRQLQRTLSKISSMSMFNVVHIELPTYITVQNIARKRRQNCKMHHPAASFWFSKIPTVKYTLTSIWMREDSDQSVPTHLSLLEDTVKYCKMPTTPLLFKQYSAVSNSPWLIQYRGRSCNYFSATLPW